MSVVVWDGKTLSSDTRAWVAVDFNEIKQYTKEEQARIKSLLDRDSKRHDFAMLHAYHESSDTCKKILIRPGLLIDGLKVKAIGHVGDLEVRDVLKSLPNGTELSDFTNNPLRQYDGRLLLVTEKFLYTMSHSANKFDIKASSKNTIYSMGAGTIPQVPCEIGFMTSDELVRLSCMMSTAQGGNIETWQGKGTKVTSQPFTGIDTALLKKYFDSLLTLKTFLGGNPNEHIG